MLHEPDTHALKPGNVVKIALIAGAVVILGLLAWRLADVLLLIFAAVLFAVVLRSLANIIEKHTPLPPRAALAVAVLLVGGIAAAFIVLLGAQIRSEFTELATAFPDAVRQLGDRVGIDDLWSRAAQRAEDIAGQSGFLERVLGYTYGVLGALGGLLLVAVAGVFLANRPERYRRGLLLLLPKGLRPEGRNALDNMGYALQRWLIGQIISMGLVGTLITAGLLVIGMPSALALGFLAGVSEFVPVVGPIASAVPAVVLAFSEGGSTVWWVLALYLVVQQIESNLIMPLVQQRVVEVPPVVTLFAVVALGVLFGPLGIVLGTPLTVVLFIAVKQLYIRDVLDEDTVIPGETE